MSRTKKGLEYVCEVCGTTLLVTDAGIGILEDVVCCAKPMKARAKKAGKAKKKPVKKRQAR